MLKALKKFLGKDAGEQPAAAPAAPVTVATPTTPREPERREEPALAAATVSHETAQPSAEQTKAAKPRRQQPVKAVDTWKLEDFAVEPTEGKTRFHDFALAPSLMHAIHDLGFPYCTPIQA